MGDVKGKRTRVNVIIMAGGRGSRLGYAEKPLVEVCGRPMVEGALRAAAALGEPALCISPFAQGIEGRYCRGITCVKGSGDYVADLETALKAVGTPALVLPADMPFLDRGIGELRLFARIAMESRAPVVTLNVCRLGRCNPSGISAFKRPGGEWEDVYVSWRAAFMDVDYPEDLEEARELCGTMGEGAPGE